MLVAAFGLYPSPDRPETVALRIGYHLLFL
jgi:hypothetical protein